MSVNAAKSHSAKNKKMNKVKSMLISQPKPENKKHPYFDLAKKFKIKINFRPFIHVELIAALEFRKTKINLRDYSAVIFNSMNAVDHFFRISQEMRVVITMDTKYFCMTEAVALYLQKYILYRKRKVFFADGTLASLRELFEKYNEEKYLFPCADVHSMDIPEILEEIDVEFVEAIMYRTVASDLTDLAGLNYDMIVFFSPSGVKSLFKNFPKFKQGDTKIAALGPTTCQAALDLGLKLDVKAPTPEAPSMALALDKFLQSQ